MWPSWPLRPVRTWARAAYVIVNDIDPEELKKPSVHADMRIHAADSGSDEEWIYRFTYNPAEKVLDGREIVLLFGFSALSIDGVTYQPEDGVAYDAVLEWAEGVYDYYAG